MIDRFMQAYERSTEAFTSTAKAQERTADVLRDFKDELKGINGRIDRLVEKG